MPKLKCDNPMCENFGKELESVDWVTSAIAHYDAKQDNYEPKAEVADLMDQYYLQCPKCGIVIEEP